MAKKHLTFDCPVCHEPDEVVARVGAATVGGETGTWHCFACEADGVFSVTLTPDGTTQADERG